ncbi:MAG: hypothetical protein GY863_10020 [bacterium]|nr:hypothetical protein [bacterium]
MAGVIDIFSTKTDTIEIEGVKNLIVFCRYKPMKLDEFVYGLELAEDLHSEEGVTLYTSGTSIAPNHVKRLVELTKTYPNLELVFKIKRTKTLLDMFRKELTDTFKRIFKSKARFEKFKVLMDHISTGFFGILEDIFKDEKILLTLYKLKFITDSSTFKNSRVFLNHSYCIVIYTYGIMKTKEFRKNFEFEEEDIYKTLMTAFLHNYSAILNMEKVLAKSMDSISDKYMRESRESDYIVNELSLHRDIQDAIRNVNDYFHGRDRFISGDDKKEEMYANVVLVAVLFNQYDFGLFVDKYELSKNLDQLNVMAMNEKLNKKTVQSITIAFKFQDLFDFYMEMENLHNMCEWKHGRPYPMTGFKSPTLFLCKEGKKDCEHFEISLKAVAIVKKVGDLEEGKYARCKLTTPRLLDFYKEHYSSIKKEYKGNS